MKNLESSLENILEAHPYLIDKKFESLEYKVERQFTIDKFRLDLLISKENEKNIIEIKKTKLSVKDYQQIQNYYKKLKATYKKVKIFGYLIGYKNELICKKYKWLNVLYLDKDIPSQVQICKTCRKVFDKYSYECKYCFSRV